MAAALSGHTEVVKFLILEMHCEPTSRNANNNIAVHLVVIGKIGFHQIASPEASSRPLQHL